MFYFDDFFGKKILKSDLLSEYDCFFTTRDFVLTPAQRKDLIEEANKNRFFLSEKLNNKDIKTANQVHGTNIEIITQDNSFYENTDAMISNIPGSVFIMNFADCVPIILYSKKDNTGAIVHAGWRGTSDKIAEKTVFKMKNELNIPAENITALIGPSIGKCCFETHEDVFNKLIYAKENNSVSQTIASIYETQGYSENSEYSIKNNKYFIDLKELNKKQLINSGVLNIDICDYCTCCMSDIFFSYRKENSVTARHSAVVKIKEGNICL